MNLELSHEKRTAISELLSLLDLSSDLQIQNVILTRVRLLMRTGTQPWKLSDDSIVAILQREDFKETGTVK